MKTWLILDCNYLCHRAFHTTGALAFQGEQTGVTFGFLRDIHTLKDRFLSTNFVFCWDFGKGLRHKVCPTYKANRNSNQKQASWNTFSAGDIARLHDIQDGFNRQMKLIRKEHLSTLGYNNNFWQDGYEADDIIAKVCDLLPKTDEAIIVSADKDLYQLINERISCFNPSSKQYLTLDGFVDTWKIFPNEWPMVKAIAGCRSDNIQGVPGVGDKTAVKYLRKEFKPGTRIPKLIKQHQAMWEANLPLVLLPYAGCRNVKLVEDVPTQKGWEEVADRLGMNSLRELNSLIGR
jgi:DNA polymerase-1